MRKFIVRETWTYTINVYFQAFSSRELVSLGPTEVGNLSDPTHSSNMAVHSMGNHSVNNFLV